MGQKDIETLKLSDYVSFMNQDFNSNGNLTNNIRKNIHSKATPSINKVLGTHQSSDRPRRIEIGRSDLPTLNLTKVRRNLEEQAELATSIYDEVGPSINKKDDISFDVAGVQALVSARFGCGLESRIDKVKNILLSERTQRNGGLNTMHASHGGETRVLKNKGDILSEATPRPNHGLNREKNNVIRHSKNSHPIVLATHLASPSKQNSKQMQKVDTQALNQNRNKNVTFTCRGVTTPRKTNINNVMKNTIEGSNDIGLNVGSTLINKLNASCDPQNLESSEGSMKSNSSPCDYKKIVHSHQTNNYSKLDSHVRGKNVQDCIMSIGNQMTRVLPTSEKNEQKIKMTGQVQLETNVESEINHRQLQTNKIKPPKLNLGFCQTSLPLGFGGNPIETIQTSRISNTQVVGENSPRLALTERGSSKKNAIVSTYQKCEKIDAMTLPTQCFPTTPTTSEIVLKQCASNMTEFEQQEILPYVDIFFLGLDCQKIRPSSTPGNCNFGFDDERGDYNVVEHDHLAYRYEVLGILGKGSFGQVLKCSDHKYKVLRAVKMIRNKRRFHQQALVEVKILEHLRNKATMEATSTNIVTIYESFYFRGHLCITFALHDISLYELIKRNNFQGISPIVIKSFASQLLSTLRFLKKLHVIHCDLKPENILLQHPAMSKIKVIDFGSSCFNHERIYTYIQSRFYRSPEVILGLPYDMMIDIWSFGCILAELFSGYPLFPGENEVEQLACMMEVLGVPPNAVLENATRKKMFFDSNNSPRIVANSWGKKHWPGTKDISVAIGCNDPTFVNFLEGCLRWDKNQRLSPDELMQHSWIVGAASPVTPQRSLKSSDTPHRSSKQSKQNSSSTQAVVNVKPHPNPNNKMHGVGVVKFTRGGELSLLPPIGEGMSIKDAQEKKRNN
ncbi:hypothetical protein BDL97_02G002600 [Sphagnum fallax]|nr:hypothetical protein BDL97_02G002600 [Sphagnum fallax]